MQMQMQMQMLSRLLSSQRMQNNVDRHLHQQKDFHVRDKSSFPSSQMNRIDFNLGFFGFELSKLARIRPV